MPEAASTHRSGFVSLIGRPNTGKSTLLNALVGSKLAIVTDKPQTTRTSVQGVLTLDNAQIVFLDTPGIHKSDTLFNRRMMLSVRAALEDRDVVVFLADASRPVEVEDSHAVDMLRRVESPVLLALNKVDKLSNKVSLLPLIEKYKSLREFQDYFPISALSGEGIGALRDGIVALLPEGPAFFPPDYLTDQPERYLAAEMIREKALELTRQEVPHAVAVLVDEWQQTPTITRIVATVYVEREGQKGIMIGARGAMAKQIGTLAREEIERFLGRKVFLQLFVKVRPGWRESPEFLNEIDWRSMAGTEDR